MNKKAQSLAEKYPPVTPQQTALGELLKSKGFTESKQESPAPAAKVADTPLDLTKAGKIVLRREKKGRGGKTVTTVNGLTLPAPRLEQLARDMRKGLGCGATVENGLIILQGDIQQRAQEWLTKHGATRVVLGN